MSTSWSSTFRCSFDEITPQQRGGPLASPNRCCSTSCRRIKSCEPPTLTISDLQCDICGAALLGPSRSGEIADERAGVTFAYHPGDRRLGDKSGLLCERCRTAVVAELDAERPLNRCARCGVSVTKLASLHVSFGGDPNAWQMCGAHAVEFLNRLRTVEPKLIPEEFRFPLAPCM
jgi:hypothetical protein